MSTARVARLWGSAESLGDKIVEYTLCCNVEGMGAESADTAIGGSGLEEECDCEEFELSGYKSLVGRGGIIALGNVDGADMTGGEAGGVMVGSDCTIAEAAVVESTEGWMARDSASLISTPPACVEGPLRREKRDLIQRITSDLGLGDGGRRTGGV